MLVPYKTPGEGLRRPQRKKQPIFRSPLFCFWFRFRFCSVDATQQTNRPADRLELVAYPNWEAHLCILSIRLLSRNAITTHLALDIALEIRSSGPHTLIATFPTIQ